MRYKAGIETRDRILGATRVLIAEAGLEGTTIKAICERAGVLPGSFYNLFDSKEQAIITVVREAIEAIDPDPDHVGSEDTLSDLVEAYIRFVHEEGDLASAYIAIAVSGGRSNDAIRGRFLRHHEMRVDRFAAAIARGRPELGDAETKRRAETLVSALNGITLHGVLDAEFDFVTHARALLGDALTLS